jgi:hypothetical protein
MIHPAPIGLGLMCKPPRPGASKTRLAAGVGPEAAARLARAFLQDSAANARRACAEAHLAPAAFFRPEGAAAELAAILGPDWPLSFADCGDLGATMWLALSGLLAERPAGAMIMGADLPLMSPAAIARAAEALRAGDEASAVVMPTVDGGYGLIGVRSEAAAPLFAPMAWSTPAVLPETVARASRHGLALTVLAPERDIDDADDLAWLRAELAHRPSEAPATRAALAAL